MSDAVFGPVITPLDVEAAVTNTIKRWMGTYLQFLARKRKLLEGSYPEVRSYRAADSMDERFLEQQIPAVQTMFTINNSLYVEPLSAVGKFDGMIDVLVESFTPEGARENATIYAFAIGLLLAQHSELDGSIPIEGLTWHEISVPAIGKPDARWLALGSIGIHLGVRGIYDQEGGPAEPDVVGPPPDRTLIESHKVLLDEEPPPSEESLYPDEDVYPDDDTSPN